LTPKQFQQFLKRDQVCYHCGINNDTLIPQHRAGRGMGGVKSRNTAANIIVFCSYANGLLESDAKFAELGRNRGWKLHSWQEPTTTPVWDVFNACWWLLDDQGNRTLTVQPDLV
jgi:hypothetical protein